jgi:non-ribosomal peptide synthetase component F
MKTPFVDYLNSVKRLVAEASEHQEYFFGKLVSKLHLPRGPSRSPLVAITFNLGSGEFRKNIHGLEVELETRKYPYRNPAGTAMFEMYVNAGDKNGDLEIQCDHKTDLIDPETMQRWLGHWKTLLEAIASNPELRLMSSPLSAEEERQLLVD